MKKKVSSASEQSTTTASHESAAMKQTATGRETQRYTYWNDSALYQYEVVKEKIDKLKLAREASGLQQEVKAQSVEKTSTPDWKWIVGLLAAGALICYILIKRLIKK